MSDEKRYGIIDMLKAYLIEILLSRISALGRKIRRYGIALVIVIASLGVIIYGIGSLLGSFFPGWLPGTSHILVGIIFILIAWAWMRYD